MEHRLLAVLPSLGAVWRSASSQHAACTCSRLAFTPNLFAVPKHQLATPVPGYSALFSRGLQQQARQAIAGTGGDGFTNSSGLTNNSLVSINGASAGFASSSTGPTPATPASPTSATTPAPPSQPPPAKKSPWEQAKAAAVKNFLPLAFATALVWALVWPDPGAYLVGIKVAGNIRIAQVLPVVLVFLISGLQLDTKDMRAALSARNLPALAYGLIAILAITPLLGFVLRELPLEPKEFATGLAVFSVAPTTLGVGVALTAACGGNEALALLLTVATNALAVFTMPPELQLLLPPAAEGAAGAGAVNVNVFDLLTKLAATVLVPFVLGKAAREYLPGAAAFAKAHRGRLSLFSTASLAFVVWQTLSSARDLLLAQQPGPLAAMVAAALGMHLFYLAANFAVVWWVL